MKNCMINWVKVSIFFMTNKAQNSKQFLRNYLVKRPLLSLVMTILVIKVRNSGEPFFIEIDVERSNLTLKRLSQTIQREFKLSEDIFFVITKRGVALIRDYKNVKSRTRNRINSGRQIRLITIYTDMNHDKSMMQTWSYVVNFRSSRLEVFHKESVLRNFAKFTGKHLCQSLFFNKVEDWVRFFPVNFAKFLGTPFVTEDLRQLLL